MAEQEKDDDERCPLCPISGPPTRSTIDADKSSLQATDDSGNIPTEIEDSSLFWIACSKCSTWYHSCCLLLNDEGVRESVPQAVRDEVGKNIKGDGPFHDWTVWINRWYCKTCLDLANDPANPNRPHHPLVTTTKPNFPPRQPKRKSVGLVRASSTSSRGVSAAPAKRAKVETTEESSRPDQDEKDASGPSRPKRQAALNRPDYHALHHHIATPTGKWLRLIADPEKYNTTILDGDFPRIRGDMVTRAWIEARLNETESSNSHAPGSLFYGTTREPLIVRPEDGGFEAMGGKLPDKSFTVQDVARLVGPDRQVDVIDVATQSSAQWSLKQWAEYVRTGVDPTGNSSKVYNIISLEVTGTELAKQVRAPRLVREIDWVDNFWNFPGGKGVVVDEKNHQTNGINETEGHLETNGHTNGTSGNGDAKVHAVKEQTHTNGTAETKPKGKAPSSWPKVQLYCLMGMKGSWTDWHVDFAASSVYYTIHTGSKVFYFIRPTERNLKAYNEWSGSYEMQQNTWLGDMCDEVRRVVLIEGDTMIIPAGYIHAVASCLFDSDKLKLIKQYTPMNSIVFGGNFVHSYDIPAQLRLRQIEIDTKVPQRFRFPLFDKLCWYVADKYCSELRQARAYRARALSTLAPPHHVVLEGLVHLANFLISQTDIIENPDEEDKKRSLTFNKIPHEIVKDPSGLARELLWRVKRELGHEVDRAAVAEALQPQTTTKQPLPPAKSKSRKDLRKSAISRTVNFDPIPWESNDPAPERTTQIVTALRPDIGKEQEAELMTMITSSYRRRIRETENGQIVLEEQDLLFTQRKTVWEAIREEVPDGEALVTKEEKV